MYILYVYHAFFGVKQTLLIKYIMSLRQSYSDTRFVVAYEFRIFFYILKGEHIISKFISSDSITIKTNSYYENNVRTKFFRCFQAKEWKTLILKRKNFKSLKGRKISGGCPRIFYRVKVILSTHGSMLQSHDKLWREAILSLVFTS